MNIIEAAVQELQIADIMSVYSGKAGACCCGCSGKHRYASAHREVASKNRGYLITDDEVNDQQVRKVLRIVQSQAGKAESFGTGYSVEQGARLYCVYLLPIS